MQKFKLLMRYLLAMFFVAAGLNHFVHPGFYLQMMPPYLPWHLALIYISGFFEVVLGALVLFPRFIRIARWGMIALLIAVFPANLHMALNPHLFPNFSPIGLWIRLPFQLAFILWVWWATRPDAAEQNLNTSFDASDGHY